MQQLWGKGHRATDCWYKKKEKEYDVDNIFLGAVFCGKAPKNDKEEDPIECLGDSSASLHTT